jgi:hypothetical protein
MNMRVTRQFLRRGQPTGHCVARARFKWILRADQPPDIIQTQPVHCRQRDLPVAVMRRVETAAKQADSEAARKMSDLLTHSSYLGRVSPWPRTLYLKLVNCSNPTGPRA